MTKPVYINHKSAGTLSVTQDGLYTVFEVTANADGLVRLWVYGGGKSAYLGIMEPTGSGLYLRRRLSRRELANFPDPIEFASDQEETGLHNDINVNSDGDRQTSAAEEEGALSDSIHDKEPKADQQKGETDCVSCPWPAAVPEEGLLWYRRPDGSLVSFDGVSSLLAIPAELRTADAQMTERVIEGKKYLVFRY